MKLIRCFQHAWTQAKLAGRDFDMFIKAALTGGLVVRQYDQMTLKFSDPYITYRVERAPLELPYSLRKFSFIKR